MPTAPGETQFIVGCRVKHKFETDGNEEWFMGKVYRKYDNDLPCLIGPHHDEMNHIRTKRFLHV